MPAVALCALFAPSAAAGLAHPGVRVLAQLAHNVTLRVDGRHRATMSRRRTGRYAFGLDARRFSPGVHHVLVRVTYLDGSQRTLRATFYRCVAARPQYTG